ncbi:MAG: helix-turn-helix transcriptional regulator [Gaiellaceae bacterium]
MKPVEQFAENVRRIRAQRGLSQEALGDASGLHRTEISLLERGAREPRLTTIVRLARALKVKPARLLEDVE